AVSDLPALNDQSPAPSGKMKDEIEAARTLVYDMENGLALDLLPAASLTSSGEATDTPATRIAAPQETPEHDTAALPATPASAPANSAKTDAAQAVTPSTT